MSTHCDFLCRPGNHSASCRAVAYGIAWYKMFGSKRVQAAAAADSTPDRFPSHPPNPPVRETLATCVEELPPLPPLLTRGESTAGQEFNESIGPNQARSSRAAEVAAMSSEQMYWDLFGRFEQLRRQQLSIATSSDRRLLALESNEEILRVQVAKIESILLDDELDHSSDEDYEDLRSDTETLPSADNSDDE